MAADSDISEEVADINSEDLEETIRRRTFDAQKYNLHNGAGSGMSYNQVHPTMAYRNAREYAQALQPWLHNYRYMMMSSQLNAFYSMMPYMSCVPNVTNTEINSSNFQLPLNNNRPTATPSVNRQQPVNNSTSPNSNPTAAGNGVLYKVPTFWRRVAAELIDFTLLFYIKLLVTLFVMKRWGHRYDAVDYQELFTMEELDYDKAFAITSEVIAMEIINRMLITIFETLCLRHGIGTVGGATPGKRLLGLKLISGEHIVDQGNGKILVSPASDVGWLSAFVRSSIKNFTIAFFLPACLTLFFHSHNRTIYDVITKTIVVQKVDRDER